MKRQKKLKKSKCVHTFWGHAQTRKCFTQYEWKSWASKSLFARTVPCLCSKYHFSEGELSATRQFDEEYFLYLSHSTPNPTSIILFYLFSRWILKRNTWAFLSAKWRGLHVFLVLKTSRHLKIWQTFWGKIK